MIAQIITELQQLRENLIDLPGWKAEIKLIDEKANAFGDINYSEIGFKSGGKTFTIEDLLAKDETKKNGLMAKVIHTEYDLREFETEIMFLDEDEQQIIREKYLGNLNVKDPSFYFIATRTMFSKTSVKRIHDEAMLKIVNKRAEYIGIA